MSNSAFATTFRQMTKGHNFLISSQADKASALIILPPFADEMNKSRHIISQFMRQATQQGFSCYLMDNFGTGDSEGDLEEATMALWRADLTLLVEQLAAEGFQQVSFLAIRFGALQLFDLLNSSSLAVPVKEVLLWQPYFDVKKFWQQFFRIKIAEQMALGEKLSQQQLEQQLAEGEVIEIAGYPLAPAFYQSTLQGLYSLPEAFGNNALPLHWLEVSQLAAPGVALKKQLEQLQAHCQLNFQLVNAAPFWNTTELASADELLRLSLAQLGRSHV
ncbi:glycosyl transferase [Arsukibacterium ikkense]|uniref:Glycosyl transferase n=1 Tax=Arsukibacterium ikkense TaxID=336831 RepID=A0A0M2V7R7_9GAMM|nr:glycosyl transferase [Arsukibacterium ikkense]KKO46897.1 glycosyl transferase [Arsukibacterium ikkense]